MNFRIHILSLTMLSLIGCHSYQPMPVDLDEHLVAFAHRAPVHPPDQSLERHVARELAKMLHPDARLARRRADVATAQRDHAGAWVDPQLQTTLQRILEDAVAYKGVVTAQVAFTLPINGRLEKQRELAGRRRDVALVEAWATEQQVANELDRAWIDWTAATRRAELFAATSQSLKQLEQVAYSLVDAGSLSRPGARVFLLERSQKEAGHAMALAEQHASRLSVLQSIGLHPDATLTLAADLSIDPFVADPSDRRAALQESPRLRVRQSQYQTTEANLLLQIRKQWPDLQLAPGWQEEDGEPRASLGFNLPLPIFTGNDPAIAKAAAERELAAEALRTTIEQLSQDLAIVEIRHAAAAAQAARFDELLPLADQQVEDGRRLANSGQLDPMLILDALLRVHNVRLAAIDANATAAHAAIDLNTLLTDPRSNPPKSPNGDAQ